MTSTPTPNATGTDKEDEARYQNWLARTRLEEIQSALEQKKQQEEKKDIEQKKGLGYGSMRIVEQVI